MQSQTIQRKTKSSSVTVPTREIPMEVALASQRGGETFSVDAFPATIGRAADVRLRIVDPTISRRHCELQRCESGLLVCDLGSTNGTYVNGLRVTEAALLLPGDRLTLGRLAFTVRYE